MVLLLESHSRGRARFHQATNRYQKLPGHRLGGLAATAAFLACLLPLLLGFLLPAGVLLVMAIKAGDQQFGSRRSEEHTSELQSLMRTSYAVLCLKQKTHETTNR